MRKGILSAALVMMTCLVFGQVKTINVMISPNPARDFCTISVSQSVEARVYDLQGTMVLKPERGESFDLDLTALPYGIYFVHLIGQSEVRTVRLVRSELGI
ncbi:MAG: T9SS type A sorting domain-containing protein [Cryomorphaceae bacterium]|nr:T9SS type A sorting domain-containing protein [Cryomorphaceae bacterium]